MNRFSNINPTSREEKSVNQLLRLSSNPNQQEKTVNFRMENNFVKQ
jgi:hypothetical protein